MSTATRTAAASARRPLRWPIVTVTAPCLPDRPPSMRSPSRCPPEEGWLISCLDEELAICSVVWERTRTFYGTNSPYAIWHVKTTRQDKALMPLIWARAPSAGRGVHPGVRAVAHAAHAKRSLAPMNSCCNGGCWLQVGTLAAGIRLGLSRSPGTSEDEGDAPPASSAT